MEYSCNVCIYLDIEYFFPHLSDIITLLEFNDNSATYIIIFVASLETNSWPWIIDYFDALFLKTLCGWCGYKTYLTFDVFFYILVKMVNCIKMDFQINSCALEYGHKIPAACCISFNSMTKLYNCTSFKNRLPRFYLIKHLVIWYLHYQIFWTLFIIGSKRIPDWDCVSATKCSSFHLLYGSHLIFYSFFLLSPHSIFVGIQLLPLYIWRIYILAIF